MKKVIYKGPRGPPSDRAIFRELLINISRLKDKVFPLELKIITNLNCLTLRVCMHSRRGEARTTKKR